MKRSMVLLTVVAACLLRSSTASAVAASDAASFRLPADTFPPGSTIIKAHIEPNRRVHRDNVLHFGKPFAKVGRITGYFMEAIEGKRSFPRVDTSYLVSLFGTSEQAKAAFEDQRYYWDVGSEHSAYVPLGVRSYGDTGDDALFSTLLPTGTILTELLFQRGTVFVEVFQEVNIKQPSDADVRSFFAIGRQLDVLAQTVGGEL